jgi:hypothetical protein
VDLIVIHHKTSDTLRLALYQNIGKNWQNYEQGIMSQPQLTRHWERYAVFLKAWMILPTHFSSENLLGIFR